MVQYRWNRSQQRFESEAAAHDAGQWVELTEPELRQYGGWVSQAIDGMVTRRERLATFSGAVGIVIDGIGTAAVGFFSGAISGLMRASPGAQQPPMQPPAQGGGHVIPFPSPTPQVPLPAASGM